MTDWSEIATAWRRRSMPRGAIAKRAGVSVRTLRIVAKAAGWETDGGSASSAADRDGAIDAARALYADLRAELLRALDALRATAADDASTTQAIAGLVKDHKRALFALIDAEERLARRGGRDGASSETGAPVLDLAAARAEINRRLARLVAADAPREADR